MVLWCRSARKPLKVEVEVRGDVGEGRVEIRLGLCDTRNKPRAILITTTTDGQRLLYPSSPSRGQLQLRACVVVVCMLSLSVFTGDAVANVRLKSAAVCKTLCYKEDSDPLLLPSFFPILTAATLEDNLGA